MTPRLLALHRWLGLAAGPLIVVAAGTAIALNHPDMLPQPSAATAADDPFPRAPSCVLAGPNGLLAGTADGLFRSADGGARWEEAVLPVPAEHVVALAVDPRRAATVWVALRDIGVYRSDDGGDTWAPVALPFDPAASSAIHGLTASAGGLAILTADGVWRGGPGAWTHAPRAGAAAAADAGGVRRMVAALHDGRWWGRYGGLLMDGAALALVALVGSGYAVVGLRARRRRRAAA